MLQQPQGAVCHWKSLLSRAMMQTARCMRKTENVTEIMTARQITANQRRRIGIMTAPQIMTVAWPLGMAGLMNLMIPQSIAAQRSSDYAVRVHQVGEGIDTPAHHSVLPFWHLQCFIQLW